MNRNTHVQLCATNKIQRHYTYQQTLAANVNKITSCSLFFGRVHTLELIHITLARSSASKLRHIVSARFQKISVSARKSSLF